MTARLLAAGALLLMPVACSSDDDASPNEAACDRWTDLLANDSDASDAQAISVLRDMEALGPTGDVAQFTTALRARLEDGVDISASMAGLSDACGLDG